MVNKLIIVSALLVLIGCGESNTPQPVQQPEPEQLRAVEIEPAVELSSAIDTSPVELDAVLADQPEDVQARFLYRHPKETLEFFGIKPGMSVVEPLPGRGWYSKILLGYLGKDGQLIGADYAADMYALFGFMSPEALIAKETWVTTWTGDAEGWRNEDSAGVQAFVLGTLPEQMKASADAVVSVRALHNLARFEDQGQYLSKAIQNFYDVLKPGGILGIVQHEARADMPDDWANGSNGYIKKAFLIERLQQAGFEFVGETDINNNPKDQPTVEDFVWRLPPTLRGARDNPELKAQREAIGETNRMTLKFRKPE
ncbi:MAG: hypothetical protein V7711_13610 [Pseudomonadales bacterium]